jgi:hypothetical protein
VDTLPTVLPGLKSLRIGHNPIYENEDDYILTLARLGQLEELGYSTVSLLNNSKAMLAHETR